MINILVIDDDSIKRGHILQAIHSIPELARQDIATAADLVQARDLLILVRFQVETNNPWPRSQTA
jgi:hypothetical protein